MNSLLILVGFEFCLIVFELGRFWRNTNFQTKDQIELFNQENTRFYEVVIIYPSYYYRLLNI